MSTKFVMILALIVLMTFSSVSATELCLNSSYRQWTKTIDLNGTQYDFEGVPDYCPGGCVNGECKPLDDQNVMAFSILFSVFSFAFIYLGLNLREENRILGWLFIPMALVMMISAFFTIVEHGGFSQNVSNILSVSGFAVILILVFVIAFFIIMLITKLFSKTLPYSVELKGNV